jgi:hypothetical protein
VVGTGLLWDVSTLCALVPPPGLDGCGVFFSGSALGLSCITLRCNIEVSRREGPQRRKIPRPPVAESQTESEGAESAPNDLLRVERLHHPLRRFAAIQCSGHCWLQLPVHVQVPQP